MAQFIHLAAEKDRRSILRGGIKVARAKRALSGVFAHPQTESFVVSHQWMRELRRVHGLRLVGVRFRVPDSERVWLGKFNAEHVEVAAAEAIGIARQHTDPLGLEVIVPRPIRAKEIESIYIPQRAAAELRRYAGRLAQWSGATISIRFDDSVLDLRSHSADAQR